MAARAARIAGERLRLVLGGFHLAGIPREKLVWVIHRLREAAESLAPGHCTGKEAMEILLATFPRSEALKVGFSCELPR